MLKSEDLFLKNKKKVNFSLFFQDFKQPPGRSCVRPRSHKKSAIQLAVTPSFDAK